MTCLGAATGPCLHTHPATRTAQINPVAATNDTWPVATAVVAIQPQRANAALLSWHATHSKISLWVCDERGMPHHSVAIEPPAAVLGKTTLAAEGDGVAVPELSLIHI